MKKYAVYGLASANILIGEYEAENEEQALELASDDKNADWMVSLCWECSRKVEIGDILDTEVVEINGSSGDGNNGGGYPEPGAAACIEGIVTIKMPESLTLIHTSVWQR